jgi:hypothetical protein
MTREGRFMKNQSAKPGFIQQIEASKKSVQSWPAWMQSSATTATASLPRASTIGPEKKVAPAVIAPHKTKA